MPRALWGVLACALLVVSACAQGGMQAVVASSQRSLGVGESRRVLFSVVDSGANTVLASPERAAQIELADENGSPLATYPAEFLWVDELEGRGVYAAYLDLPHAATYRATIEVEGLGSAGPVGIVVVDDPRVIQPGEPAVASRTRTLGDSELADISSDPEPEPAFYRLSVHEAVSNGIPTVILFGSPRWCASPSCGPMLDLLKQLAGSYPGVDLIHVESYQVLDVDSADDLTTVAAVAEWGLPSEPWIFVVGGTGAVAASFEGVASVSELKVAIESVIG